LFRDAPSVFSTNDSVAVTVTTFQSVCVYLHFHSRGPNPTYCIGRSPTDSNPGPCHPIGHKFLCSSPIRPTSNNRCDSASFNRTVLATLLLLVLLPHFHAVFRYFPRITPLSLHFTNALGLEVRMISD